jgi:hypothetical protein
MIFFRMDGYEQTRSAPLRQLISAMSSRLCNTVDDTPG